MSTTAQRPLRIGEVAKLTATTPRTIRYYEEIGLLVGGGSGEDGATQARGRGLGQHRVYSQADVERIQEIVRLRDLLGLSLEQLSQLLEAESARAELRREYHQAEDPAQRRRILQQALVHIESQLGLVRRRRRDLEQLETELADKRQRARTRLQELGQVSQAHAGTATPAA